jgi:hypothetical protein
VKLIHQSLLVWLLLLALPFQGLASAGALPCGTNTPAAHPPAMAMGMDGTPHDHAAMLKAMAAQAEEGHCADSQPGEHHGSKAGSCTACCIGAAMAPATLPVLAPTPSHFISIPFRAGHVPSVDPALPERPPRTALA